MSNRRFFVFLLIGLLASEFIVADADAFIRKILCMLPLVKCNWLNGTAPATTTGIPSGRPMSLSRNTDVANPPSELVTKDILRGETDQEGVTNTVAETSMNSSEEKPPTEHSTSSTNSHAETSFSDAELVSSSDASSDSLTDSSHSTQTTVASTSMPPESLAPSAQPSESFGIRKGLVQEGINAFQGLQNVNSEILKYAAKKSNAHNSKEKQNGELNGSAPGAKTSNHVSPKKPSPSPADQNAAWNGWPSGLESSSIDETMPSVLARARELNRRIEAVEGVQQKRKLHSITKHDASKGVKPTPPPLPLRPSVAAAKSLPPDVPIKPAALSMNPVSGVPISNSDRFGIPKGFVQEKIDIFEELIGENSAITNSIGRRARAHRDHIVGNTRGKENVKPNGSTSAAEASKHVSSKKPTPSQKGKHYSDSKNDANKDVKPTPPPLPPRPSVTAAKPLPPDAPIKPASSSSEQAAPSVEIPNSDSNRFGIRKGFVQEKINIFEELTRESLPPMTSKVPSRLKKLFKKVTAQGKLLAPKLADLHERAAKAIA